MASCGDVFLGLLAILFPPLPVWIKRGLCSCDSLLNILLCLLGYLPGLLHAWYIIAQFPDADYELIPADEEGGAVNRNGRVTYYYVSREPVPAGGPVSPGLAAGTGQPDGGRAHRELQRGGSNYGTLNAGVVGQQGSSAEPSRPPTYAEAVKGDNKVQTDD